MADKKEKESLVVRHPIIAGAGIYLAASFLAGKLGEYIGGKIGEEVGENFKKKGYRLVKK